MIDFTHYPDWCCLQFYELTLKSARKSESVQVGKKRLGVCSDCGFMRASLSATELKLLREHASRVYPHAFSFEA